MSHSGIVAHDALLTRRARYGDRRAARRLAARHLERAALLASAIGTSAQESAGLVREGFARAVRARQPLDEALVTTFGALADEAADADAARGRLLVVLVDLEQRPATEVGPLLGLSTAQLQEQLNRARRGHGSPYAGRPCRGWGLVSRTGLTPQERQAGQDHLTVCRRCRDRHAALEKTRQEHLTRVAAVTGLVAASELAASALSGTGGLGAVVAGKAALGLIGALGATVLATGAAVAVTQHPMPVSRERTPAVLPLETPAARTTVPAGCDSRCSPTPTPGTSPAGIGVSTPSVPLLRSTPLPLPAVPGLPLPSGLPVLPLPSGLPVLPLPTGLLPH